MGVEVDESTGKFGLPRSLWIPVAAASVDAISRFVGPIAGRLVGRTGRVNAIKVRSTTKPDEPQRIPLWEQHDAQRFTDTLYPEFQLWVHVDYSGYRSGWKSLGMPELRDGVFLDHISNRRATRIRGYLHPFLRLCPVSRQVNTSAGHSKGGEGMEVAYTQAISRLPAAQRDAVFGKVPNQVTYADPMDLTKMLGEAPGTQVLSGVRDFMWQFYPPKT